MSSPCPQRAALRERGEAAQRLRGVSFPSTLHHVHGEAAARGFLVLGLHVGAGLHHGLDDLVERDDVRAVAAQRHARGVDGLDGAHGVALDARDLHQPAHRVAGHAQVVLHADLGGVLHLRRGAAEHGRQRARRHRAGHAHLALAADFGARERGRLFVDQANGAGREQELDDALVAGPGNETRVVVQHRRHHPGRAVGGRRDHAAAGGVLLAHGHGVEVDPVEHGQRVAQRFLGPRAQALVQRRGAPRQVQRARQLPPARTAPAHGGGHGLPDVQQAAPYLGGAVPVLFVGQGEGRHRQARGLAVRQQLGAGAVGVGQAGAGAQGVGRGLVGHVEHARAVFVHHEATADRVVHAPQQGRAVRTKGMELHAVGVVGQAFAPHQQVRARHERQRVAAQQGKLPAGVDGVDGGADLVGVDLLGQVPGQAQQHGPVGAVAHARGGERAEQLHLQPLHGGQQAQCVKLAGELARSDHGAHGVGARGADADLEQIEDAEERSGGGHAARLGPYAGRRHARYPCQGERRLCRLLSF